MAVITSSSCGKTVKHYARVDLTPVFFFSILAALATQHDTAMQSQDGSDEKHGQLNETVQQRSTLHPDEASGKDVDQACVFLSGAHANNETAHNVNMNALLRKIDWRIVPIMFLCYTMNFIDKVAYNVSDRFEKSQAIAMLTTFSSTQR